MAIRMLTLVLLAATLTACSAEPKPSEPPSTTTTIVTGSTSTTLAELDVPPELADLATATISIDGRDLLVAVADTAEVRSQGLKGVTDLGDLDGMLFVWEGDTGAAFHMVDTLIPLDLAFFSVGGGFVDRLTMEPCMTDECPSYSAGGLFGLYRYALEAPAGDLDFITADSTLVIDS